MNRGYAGFYKGHYLRSSYEYAYAKYLDYYSISWSYEDKNFELDDKIYKPDFFFYDENGYLIKIVEVKSRNEEAKKKARQALLVITERFNIECELISYKELLLLYSELPFSLTSTITEWIESEKTTINKAAYGQLNGHYNIKHNEDTKKKIGAHTKVLWSTDSPSRQRMIEGLKKSGMKKGYIKTSREIRVCDECNRRFKTLITSTQRFCSQSCAGKEAIQRATKSYVEKRNSVHQCIRDYIIEWSLNNKQLVLNTPLNKIKTTIQPLIDDIQDHFGVKDFRVISKAVFGEDRGRKELIKFMKKMCNENVC